MSQIEDYVLKRKILYQTSPNKDKSFVVWACNKLLSDKNMIAQVKAKPYLLIELLFCVVDKNKRTIPFFLNKVQREFIQTFERLGSSKPYFILKGRQQGFTTLITAMQLCYCITRRNFSGFTIADCTDNVNVIFNDKAKTVYNALPGRIKPHEKYNTRKELFFDKLNSSWRIATAGDGAGRSRTLEFAHFSEVAFYENGIVELQKSVGEALIQNAIVIYETTANGWNEAKELWDSKTCNNLFFAWWDSDEYRIKNTDIIKKVRDKDLLKKIEWLKNQKHLEDEQIAWYVNKFNMYLDKKSIMQEYPCTPEEAFIASGECVFDREAILDRLNDLKISETKGDFKYAYSRNTYSSKITDIQWVESNGGSVTILELPQKSENYVIAGDTAGSGEDYFTAVVERESDFKTVAYYRRKCIDEDLYAHQLFCLARFYNYGLLAVESNFSTAPIRELINLEYPNLFARGEGIEGVGFKTTLLTRPLIIQSLISAFRIDPTIEQSKEILLEMLSFVRNKNGRVQAVSGKHDDLVMAKCIAHFVTIEHAEQPISEHRDFIENNFNVKLKNKVGW